MGTSKDVIFLLLTTLQYGYVVGRYDGDGGYGLGPSDVIKDATGFYVPFSAKGVSPKSLFLERIELGLGSSSGLPSKNQGNSGRPTNHRQDHNNNRKTQSKHMKSREVFESLKAEDEILKTQRRQDQQLTQDTCKLKIPYNDVDNSWRLVTKPEFGHCADKTNLPDAWYRFYDHSGASATIPVSCQNSLNKCADFQSTYWLKLESDGNPEPGAWKTASVCSSNKDGTCRCTGTLLPKNNVTVLNCGPYLIYHIRPSELCDAGYCINGI